MIDLSPRVLIAFGTRPEVIKLAPVILALEKQGLKKELVVVNTEQQQHLIKSNIKLFNITVHHHLEIYKHCKNLTEILVYTLTELQKVIDKYPTIEYLVIQGDTNTALAGAQIAYFNKLKLIHVEAGLRSFDMQDPFPEEFNRVVASKVSYFHFAHSKMAALNLEREGIHKERILISGSTVVDALHLIHRKNDTVNAAKKKNLVLITLHRKQNLGVNYYKLLRIVNGLSRKNNGLKFLWIIHPNSSSIVEDFKVENPNSTIKFSAPLPYDDFIKLYNSTRLIITDSGGLQEEATLFGIPIIVYRQKTERPEPLADQYPCIVTINKDEILTFFNKNVNLNVTGKAYFGNGYASLQIAKWFKNQLNKLQYGTIIIGGGPAGTGLILKAMKDGNLLPILNKGVAIIESSDNLMAGSIANYNINSDTVSNVFLECLEGKTNNYINVNELSIEIDIINQHHNKSIPLNLLESYLKELGTQIEKQLQEHDKCGVFKNTTAKYIKRDSDGTFKVYLNNYENPVTTKNIVLATGGTQSASGFFGKKIEYHKYHDKTILSSTLLSGKSDELITRMISKNGSIVILGGNHSGFSCAWYLLNKLKSHSFGSKKIKIWGKDRPKIYFNNSEEAVKGGYKAFNQSDICLKTGKVFRLAGLRMDGRELFMRMNGMIAGETEERVVFSSLKENVSELETDLENCSLIVLALGYSFAAIPISDKNGKRIALAGEATKHWVNKRCEVLDSNNKVLKNIYGIGLATGFIPKGALGGEKSFSGQTNGIWYYQNDIAGLILENIK